MGRFSGKFYSGSCLVCLVYLGLLQTALISCEIAATCKEQDVMTVSWSVCVPRLTKRKCKRYMSTCKMESTPCIRCQLESDDTTTPFILSYIWTFISRFLCTGDTYRRKQFGRSAYCNLKCIALRRWSSTHPPHVCCDVPIRDSGWAQYWGCPHWVQVLYSHGCMSGLLKLLLNRQTR